MSENNLFKAIRWTLSLTLFLAGILDGAMANDSEAGKAAGGIRLLKDARISIQKEKLTISQKRVTVEYEFLNETDKDISAIVAFPIQHMCYEGECGAPVFADFRVWVGGTEVKYSKEAKALLHGKDYSSVLRGLAIDIASYGHFEFQEDDQPKYEVEKLPEKDKQELVRLGLVDPKGFTPEWGVEEMYYWTETFPASKTIHVRHEYSPAYGYSPIEMDSLDKKFPDACIDAGLRKKLSTDVQSYLALNKEAGYTDYIFSVWVNYILTTANNWKTPIKDFELIVEKPERDEQHGAWYVSLCWDGPVERLDENHFVARKRDFIPKRELAVYFFAKAL
jgi:hypothetical protein